MLSIIRKRNFLTNIIYQSSAIVNVHLFSSTSSLKDHDRHTIFSILNPFIDFEERLKSSNLQNSLTKRNLKINLDHLCKLWDQFKVLENTKFELEQSKNEIAEKIKSYTNIAERSNEISGLKIAGKVIRQDIKNITATLSDLENKLLSQVIGLPNDLKDEFFSQETELFFSPKPSGDHHLDVGKRLDLIEYISPAAYFLRDDAAFFELDIASYFVNTFCNNGFIPVSNPDFSRSLIIDGINVNTDSILKLERDKGVDDLFLNGSASVFPFCSFHTKQVSNSVPIKYVTQGRHYQKCEYEDGLYSVCQNTAVQIFIASSESRVLKDFNSVLEIAVRIYKNLGLHFRIKKIPASELELFEAIRLSFQIHSPFKKDFIEVGNLSFYSDYISKRLRMYYKDGDEKRFLHLISGTVVKIPPLLASFLEHNNGCKLPENLFHNKIS